MKTYLRKTKIVGTIGPASENRLPELFKAGLNVCRINYSHGSYDEQKEKTETIIKLREELDLPIPMILDMQGQDREEKWSDLWYIFKPNGFNKTLAEMSSEERENRRSVDGSVQSMNEFAKWYEGM